MSHKKRRVTQHIMEDQSLQIIRSTLPNEWVIRDYKPDYGIDIAVELFEYIDGSSFTTETLGEWFFGQVKAVAKTSIQIITEYPRFNVEKAPLRKNKKESLEIEVIPFQMDTDELLTIQALGSGVPVLLLLVTLDTGNLYFVCLNDILDKCIIPNDPMFSDKQTKVIHVPVQNRITSNHQSLVPIKFLAKRPKLYSAFSKFTYQEHEVAYILNHLSMLPVDFISESPELNTLLHFLRIIKRYDFWETTDMWTPIRHAFDQISNMEYILNSIKENKQLPRAFLLPDNLPLDESKWDQDELMRFMFTSKIQSTWSFLKNLNNMYEEICREWFLPTYLAQLSSYP